MHHRVDARCPERPLIGKSRGFVFRYFQRESVVNNRVCVRGDKTLKEPAGEVAYAIPRLLVILNGRIVTRESSIFLTRSRVYVVYHRA